MTPTLTSNGSIFILKLDFNFLSDEMKTKANFGLQNIYWKIDIPAAPTIVSQLEE